jgi:branched-chain amino acid transport system permease protein
VKRLLWIGGTIAALALLQWLATTLLLDGPVRQGAYYYQILLLAGINVILAASLNLTNGVAGQFSIGHAGFFAVGAYAAACVSVYAGPRLGLSPGIVRDSVLLVAASLAAMLAAGVAGWLVGMPSLRLRGDYLAIVTLGFGEIIRVVILNVDAVGGARGFTGIPRLANLFWVGLGVAATLAVVRNVTKSSHGRALLAVRGDEVSAQASGVNVTRHKVTAFVVSAAFAGLAGSLFAHFAMFLHPNTFTFVKSFEIVIMIALGGLGSLAGAVLGAVTLTVLPELFREFAEYRMVVYALALIVIMIYRPRGLLGRRGFLGRGAPRDRPGNAK